MDRERELLAGAEAREREQRRQERKKKWDEWGKRFWSTFLLTEDGKPKSGFLIYSFCLSAVFIGLYLAAFHFLTELLAPVTASWPVVLGNLFGSLCVTAAVCLIGTVLHRLLPDKRLMFATYLWLALYLAAAIVTMAILLRGTGAMREFMLFALWFGLIPVGAGTLWFGLLRRRDHRPPPPPEAEPEWKKYVDRR